MTVTGGTLTAAKLLDLSSTTVDLGSRTAVAIASGGTAALSTGPAIALSGGALLTTGDLVTVASGGTLSSTVTTAALLSTSDALLTIGGALLNSAGQVTMTSSTTPLISITNGTGTHAIASTADKAMVTLSGTATATETHDDVELLLGTDRPLRHGEAAIVETSGATVTSQQGLKIDTALLEATAPLLNLKATSTMTTAVDALNLVSKAKVTSVGPVIKLDASTLAITSGAAINVVGGSLLKITGTDLIQLTNTSTLTMLNGPLLNVAGNSVVNVFGGLVNFGTGTNVINISSTTLCSPSCGSAGGITFLATNGATVSISGTPIKGTGTINLVTGANTPAIIADGASTKVTIQGN
jgi:hypothetical protein